MYICACDVGTVGRRVNDVEKQNTRPRGFAAYGAGAADAADAANAADAEADAADAAANHHG